MPKENELLQQRTELAKAVLEANELEVMYLDATLQAVRIETGFSTPCEQFITSTLRNYIHKTLSVKAIQRDLTEFEGDIELLERIVEGHAKQFPAYFKAKQEEVTRAAER